MSRQIEPRHDGPCEKEDAERYCGNYLPCFGDGRNDTTNEQWDKEISDHYRGTEPEHISVHFALRIVRDHVMPAELNDRIDQQLWQREAKR